MRFLHRREMSLVKPEMSLVNFQNVPSKCLEGVVTLRECSEGVLGMVVGQFYIYHEDCCEIGVAVGLV